MANNWTKAQQTVIDIRDKNILVSAAAGSGKTAVLVERIIKKVTDDDNPIDIDKLLVVTFTSAAASEMRERILNAIEKKAEEYPDNEHLQKQITYIHNASISTLHSFCMNLIRENFTYLDIDPSFKIGDEGEIKLIKSDVIKEVLEKYYQEKSEIFIEFIERYSTSRSDVNVEEIILKLYEFSMSYPEPEKWLDSCIKSYEVSNIEDIQNSDWFKIIETDIELQLLEACKKLHKCQVIINEADGPYMYEDAIKSDLSFVEMMVSYNYEEQSEAMASYEYVALGKKSDSEVSDIKKNQVKNIRNDVKKIIAALKKNYFGTTLEEQLECMESCLNTVKVMVELTKGFTELYKDKKEERNIIDFNDLEHYALKILVEFDENGYPMPTRAADEIAGQYEEIMVDEYQDSNYVQETIVNAISSQRFGHPNKFMVGDVKQSIYKFRLAKPELFIDKYNRYIPVNDVKESEEKNGESRRIILDKNFRSRKEVLNATNFIFNQLMGKELGGIEYDEENALYEGAAYPEIPEKQDNTAEFIILNNNKKIEVSDEIAEKNGKELEAYAAAHRIKELVGKFKVYDKNTKEYRNCRYSDIVILFRSTAGIADIYAEVLNNEGIPAYCESQTGYFSADEVITVLNMLKVIDNPRQDIPLVSVLTSQMFGMNEEMLAIVRANTPYLEYYDAINKYYESGKDDEIVKILSRFFELLNRYRQLSTYLSIYELINIVLDETGYYNYMMSMADGKRRRANLDMLKEKAATFEKGSYNGLFNFVRYIEKMQDYDIEAGEASSISENEDIVRIMTIHKSKGLEFPVVIVAGLGKKFNKTDIYDKMIIHSELGVGIDAIIPEQKLRIKTMIKKAVGRQIEKENIGEELRILYVALTRAKEKLIMLGTVKNIEKAFMKWSEACFESEEKFSPETILSSVGYIDMIGYCLARNKEMYRFYDEFSLTRPWNNIMSEIDSGIKVLVKDIDKLSVEHIENMILIDEKREKLMNFDSERIYNEEIRTKLTKQLGYEYPYKSSEKIPSKLSVSELKRKDFEEEAQKGYEIYSMIYDEEESRITGVTRGNAYHRIFELFDYYIEPSLENYKTMVHTFFEACKMEEYMEEVIDYDKILEFADSNISKRMKNAYNEGTLKREAKFVMGIPASRIDDAYNDEETVLVQGIIDAYFLEDEEIVVVDYKTDSVKEISELEKRYKTQLDYYAEALEKLTGKKVKEKIIYSVHLSKELLV